MEDVEGLKALAEARDEVFCDDGGLWVRDPRGNYRPFDINDYEALIAENARLEAQVKVMREALSDAERRLIAGGDLFGARLVRSALKAGEGK